MPCPSKAIYLAGLMSFEFRTSKVNLPQNCYFFRTVIQIASVNTYSSCVYRSTYLKSCKFPRHKTISRYPCVLKQNRTIE